MCGRERERANTQFRAQFTLTDCLLYIYINIIILFPLCTNRIVLHVLLFVIKSFHSAPIVLFCMCCCLLVTMITNLIRMIIGGILQLIVGGILLTSKDSILSNCRKRRFLFFASPNQNSILCFLISSSTSNFNNKQQWQGTL